MECQSCHAINPEGKRYCSDCGALLAPSLKQEIDAVLKERLRDQKVVEVELMEGIVNRLTGWAKTLAYLIGLPLVALGSALGFLGVKTYVDFSTLSKQASSRVAEFEQATARQDEELKKRAQTLRAGFADIEKQLEQTKALSSRVETLANEVRQIREKVDFEKSSSLTPSLRKDLGSAIDQFQAYIENVGYASKEGLVKVRIDPAYKSNTMYDPSRHTITLASNIASDRHSLLYTYVMHVLNVTRPELTMSGGPHAGAIASGLGDYYSASFLDDPKISPVLARETGMKEPYIRNIDNQRRFDDAAQATAELHARGETWGGAFWEIRSLLGQSAADKLLFRAWSQWKPGTDGDAGFAGTIVRLSGSSPQVR